MGYHLNSSALSLCRAWSWSKKEVLPNGNLLRRELELSGAKARAARRWSRALAKIPLQRKIIVGQDPPRRSFVLNVVSVSFTCTMVVVLASCDLKYLEVLDHILPWQGKGLYLQGKGGHEDEANTPDS